MKQIHELLQHGSRAHRRAGALITLPFAFAAVTLGVAVFLSGPVSRWMSIRQVKLPLPLRAPFDTLDTTSLLPYKVLERHRLEPALVEALETDQYLNWTLEDTSVGPRDPMRFANLFVTYYTGGSNLVPHTPDVCYLGAGYDPAQAHENLALALSTLQPEWGEIPARVCTFAKTAVFSKDEVSVLYTFFANGQFATGQHHVRVLLHDLQARHAYFSKVEVSFPRAGRRESIEGARKVMERVLPVLLKRHWPDVTTVENSAP